MKKVIQWAGATLTAATLLFSGLLVTAQTNDVAYVVGPSFAALETTAKRTAVKDVVSAVWPDVSTFADVQALKCWTSENGPRCWLEHDKDVSALTDAELLSFVVNGKVEPGASTVTVRRPSADATGAGLGNLASTVLGVGASDVAAVECRRDADEGQPGCHWYRLKVAGPSTWRADWQNGLVAKTLGVVAEE